MTERPGNRLIIRKRLKEFIVPEQVRQSMNEARDRKLREHEIELTDSIKLDC